MKRVSVFVVLLAVIASVVLFGCVAPSPGPDQGQIAAANGGAPVQNGVSQRAISTAELATHHTPSDCWVAMRGNVYDVTTLAGQNAPDGSPSRFASSCGRVMAFTPPAGANGTSLNRTGGAGTFNRTSGATGSGGFGNRTRNRTGNFGGGNGQNPLANLQVGVLSG